MSTCTLCYEDTPVSCGILQQLDQAGAITVDGLGDLWGIQAHSVYPYLTDRDMRYGQMRLLYRCAKDRRIQEAFNADLQRGTGWVSIYVDTVLDFDGDGDVDTDDVLGYAIEALGQLTDYLKLVRDKKDRPDLGLLGQLNQRAMQSLVASERCAEHIAKMNGKRKKARPLNNSPSASGVQR